MKKRVLAGLAFVAAALALILILSIFRSTARAVEEEPEQVGFLLIAGQVPQTEEPQHPVLTFRGVDPARCAGIEAPDEESPSQSAAPEEAAPEEVRTYLGSYKITGYDICPSCCGNTRGITASGTQATVGRTCAAGKDLPFGTVLWIDGIGYRTVEDRGGGVNGGHIDVLCNDHSECYSITGTYPVYVVEAVECSEN